MKDDELDIIMKRKLNEEKNYYDVDNIISKTSKTKRKYGSRIISVAAIIVTAVLISVFTINLNLDKKDNEIIMSKTPYLTEKTDSIIGIVYSNVDIKKLTELPREYSVTDAINDGALVMCVLDFSNEQKYYDFLEKYRNKEDAFLRYVFTTEEGDICIIDTKYDSINDKVYVISDYSRDKYTQVGDRILKFYAFDNITEVDYTTYDSPLTAVLVAHNGEYSGLPTNDSSLIVGSII